MNGLFPVMLTRAAGETLDPSDFCGHIEGFWDSAAKVASISWVIDANKIRSEQVNS